jgi:hypothetical protein
MPNVIFYTPSADLTQGGLNLGQEDYLLKEGKKCHCSKPFPAAKQKVMLKHCMRWVGQTEIFTIGGITVVFPESIR